MRFKTYPFLRLLLLLEIMSLCACTIDDGEAYLENEWVRLTATIAPLSGTSRAHVGDKGNESFSKPVKRIAPPILNKSMS